MQSFFQKKSVFVFFYIVTLIFYFPSRYAGFLTDFIGFEAAYNKCGFIHYYDCSLMPNLRYVQHLFSYLLCKTVGAGTIYWYILYCFFHALSAYLGYLVVKRLLTTYSIENDGKIAFASAILFLISPYQAEVVVWRVCIQYCFVSIALSLNILILLSYLTEQKIWKPLLAFLIFGISIFSLEQAAAIPISLLVIAVIINRNKYILKKSIALFVVPQVLFVGFYFLLSKLMYHKWIMHYGAATFEHILSFKTYSKFFSYCFKYLFLLRFIENEELKEKAFSMISQPWFIVCLSILVFYVLSRLIKNSLQQNSKSGLYLIFISLYIITMLPVIQLYDSTLLLSENDRLGYVSSLFIFTCLSVFLLDKKKKILNLLLGIILFANAYFLLKIVHYWNISNNIAYSFANNFNYYDKNEIIILGIPDNYKGIWMLRADNSALKEFIKFKLHKEIHASIDEVADYNQTAYEDGVNVKKENDSTLYVSFKQYGNWWWKGGLGMTDYENAKYKMTTDEWSGYHLIIKNIQSHNYTIIYPDSLQWKQFIF